MTSSQPLAPRYRKWLLPFTTLLLLSGLALYGWFHGDSSSAGDNAPRAVETASQGEAPLSMTSPGKARPENATTPGTVTPAFHNVEYTVEPGDTLEAIFNQQQIPGNDLYGVLEADEPYLVVDVLQPGDKLVFQLGKESTLHSLSIPVDPSKTVTYQREEDGHFSYREAVTPTRWVTDVVRGKINGSFYASASQAGLSDQTIMTIDQLFKSKLDFRRDLRAGDAFQIVIKRETIDGKPIGNNHVLAAHINAHRRDISAYLHSDGTYYDANGDNLTPALLRYPTQKRFRISSSFNPWRLNPVSGHYAPHNGVDFATPKGTPVISTGDGRVVRTATHRYAGKYIVIEEFGPYSTRYLHLSKILVHRGQHVSRGQVIGLSGNTGRSTGPHLHYELHIKGKPVNPITADIPMLKSIPKTELAAYHRHVQALQDMMAGDTQLAQHEPGYREGGDQAVCSNKQDNSSSC